MSKYNAKIRGNRQIIDKSITNDEIADDAGIQESKLSLDHGTQDLFEKSMRVDESRTVEDNVNIEIPHIIIRDKLNGKKYRFELRNGTPVTIEIEE